MKNRCCAFLFGLCLSLVSVQGEIRFSGLDLSDDNRLLFRVDSSGPLPQHGIFVSRLTDLALQQITAFPERMELVENGGVLLVRNSFGAVRIPVSGGLPRNIPGFPSFAAGAAPGPRPLDLAASADGRWILYIESRSPAYGDLVLLDAASGVRQIVTRKIEKPGRNFPARFSPDSRILVYARAGRLYYYSLADASRPAADERFRCLGDGEISSIAWSGAGDFYYFRENTLYRAGGADFFTRAVYTGFLELGAAAGKIPFDFDPAFDSFWIAPDARSILLSRSGRTVFYYPLEASAEESILPYVTIPRDAFDINVLWPPGGLVTVLASIPEEKAVSPGPVKESRVAAWRLVTGGSVVSSFMPLETPLGSKCALSPDGKRALFWGERGLALWDYVNWRPLQNPEAGPVYSCLWLGNSEYVRGDARRIERVNLAGGRRLVCLAGVSVYGFEEQVEGANAAGSAPSPILAGSGNAWYSTDGRNPWTAIPGARPRRASQASGRYRVYLERQSAGPYENLPMIRNIASVGTAALLPSVKTGAETAVPARGAPAPSASGIFFHGRREGPREVALCFDLYDDDTGLPLVLETLNRYGFKATFFLNGEFIRRNPSAARGIAGAGQEAASMFYAPIDFSDSRYRVDADFVVRGLARNEDEYYEASGDELNLLWHPPFYRASAEIAAAAARAGYLTVDRDLDPLDWVSREEARLLGMGQRSAGDIIEHIIERKQPGSIIPVRLGLLSGGESDYLFLRLNVLLDALVSAGYHVTTVSALVQRAR
ncbi:MAG: polysaccharide deacetylase family protein [Treponema sp.]|jgi:peptidoglycan/xylan/chitin deacetylase (PgdA/CDA1 family)|nr:polysaccharide deacetylase family protein [Treponema sp.]